MQTQIRSLREQLARQIELRGADDPRVEYLRWQIASLERQDRWRREAAGLFGTPRAARPDAGTSPLR
ncbi:MAG TPA: hypothetical protein VEA81_05135 [Burkholderiaceae bacterium]|nr:hypothetical protein [Burkholderiaceae bacterium]